MGHPVAGLLLRHNHSVT